MSTLKGRVLLGWMSRDRAVQFLTKDCVFDPPLDDVAAESLWASHRATVDALPDRTFTPLPSLGLTQFEAGHAARFMAFLNGLGPHEVTHLHKVDLSQLVVHQYHVVTERAQGYAQKIQTDHGWLDECLPTAVHNTPIQFRSQQRGLNTYSEIDVPHAEFFFAPNMQTGVFTTNQLLRHVTTMVGTDRTFLWAGYHRSFAKVLSTPAAAVPSAVVAVARNVLNSPVPTIAAPGVATVNGIDPLGPFGAKAARFGDFFVDGLFMDVDLRKKRYQLQVHANMVAIDDPS